MMQVLSGRESHTYMYVLTAVLARNSPKPNNLDHKRCHEPRPSLPGRRRGANYPSFAARLRRLGRRQSQSRYLHQYEPSKYSTCHRHCFNRIIFCTQIGVRVDNVVLEICLVYTTLEQQLIEAEHHGLVSANALMWRIGMVHARSFRSQPKDYVETGRVSHNCLQHIHT